MRRHARREFVPPRFSGRPALVKLFDLITKAASRLSEEQLAPLCTELESAADAPWCGRVLLMMLRTEANFNKLPISTQYRLLNLSARANEANRPLWYDQILQKCREVKPASETRRQ